MTTLRKGAALRKKAARKAKGLKPVTAPKAKQAFHPVPDDLMTKVLADMTGGMPLTKAVAANGVVKAQFFATVDRNKEWADLYTRARASLMDSVAEELLEIQDEEPPLRAGGGEWAGDPKTDPAWVAWQKNRVDARKWLLSKLAPRRYGDRVAAEISGPDQGPIETKSTLVCDDAMAALRARIAKLKGETQC